jgi:hypothetical protein
MCLETVIQVLDLIIKAAIVLGLVFLVIFYIRIFCLDKRIEEYEKEFEKKRAGLRGQGRGIPEDIINRQISEVEKEKNEKNAPLTRKRQRILSKIPFLK